MSTSPSEREKELERLLRVLLQKTVRERDGRQDFEDAELAYITSTTATTEQVEKLREKVAATRQRVRHDKAMTAAAIIDAEYFLITHEQAAA